jgi:hypothetical protein
MRKVMATRVRSLAAVLVSQGRQELRISANRNNQKQCEMVCTKLLASADYFPICCDLYERPDPKIEGFPVL